MQLRDATDYLASVTTGQTEQTRQIEIVVPISGGKDSQACLKLATQQYESSKILGLFCDTQFEHPWTYEHVENLQRLYGVEIVRVCAGDVPSEVARTGMFPSGVARFCTYRLKLRPAARFYEKLAVKQSKGFEVWVGVRKAESGEREKRYANKYSEELYAPHELFNGHFPKRLEKMGVMFKVPIVELTDEEVFALLNGTENPLYRHGMTRVGCFPCLAGGDATKLAHFQFDEFGKNQLAIVRELEEIIDQPVFKSKTGVTWDNREKCDSDEFQGCAICEI